MDAREEHAETIRRVSVAIGVSLFAGVVIGSYVSHRIGKRWSAAVNLLADVGEAVGRVRSGVRTKVEDAGDIGELATIALDAVSQQRERRHSDGPASA